MTTPKVAAIVRRDFIAEARRYAWLVVGLLWLVGLLNYLDRLLLTTMRESIKESIAMTDTQFGLLTSVFLWVYGALSPFGGFLADRFSRSKVIVASLCVWSAMTWLTGHTHTFGQLLIARGLMGVSEACYIPAALALISDYHRGSTRSLATGLNNSGIYAGTVLGGMGGYVAQLWGWRAGFSVFGGFGVFYAFVVWIFLRDPLPIPQEERIPTSQQEINFPTLLGALFRSRGFWLLLAVNVLVGAANWNIYGWLPTYLREHFNLGAGAAGLSATAYIQVASVGGVVLGGVWADYWSRRNPRGRAFVPAIGYCVVGPCLLASALTNVLPLALCGLMVFGLGRGFFDANHMPILRQLVDERYSATGYGFLNFISCAAGGVMVFVGGAMKDAHLGLDKAFQLSALGLAVAGLMLFTVKATPSSNG
jgi:MFS family permease